MRVRARLVVTGVVQGVGFRPFIYRLARRLGLAGWVLNSTEGVVVEAEGESDALDSFAAAIPREAPPQARVERVTRTDLPPIGYVGFAIEESEEREDSFALISPDLSICDDCLRELMDPTDRRHRYPFINCTNCGPRFTIVKDIPYDRPRTTMACFAMCPECESEYHDPADRRFHAQPDACPTCGPRVWLATGDGNDGRTNDEAVLAAKRLLARGGIVAVKGIGGFHLACDASSDEAVAELRRRKRRTDKPFAVMLPDIQAVSLYCHLSDAEAALLTSPQRPIVLLRPRDGAPISDLVAPGNRQLGVMLPYTPLHHLLFDRRMGDGVRECRSAGVRDSSLITHHLPVTQHSAQSSVLSPQSSTLALVMTSGNVSDEPIATGNREALERLADLADAFLLHDRDVHVRCDDSVTRVYRGNESLIRRSRGYAPFPVRLGFEVRDLLACGGQLKNTFCITRGDYAFLSQHIGDLENAETLASFAESVEHFERVFRLKVQAVACDMHPEYLSTAFAADLSQERGLPLIEVQHHHAHIAACLAENGVEGPVIGVAFDGTGYGDDGQIWGGELLIADLGSYRRAAHLKYVPLPGGEAAVRHPCRMAAAYLVDAFGPRALEDPPPPLEAMAAEERAVLARQIERRLNSPLTSSAGRLFDAASSLIGLRHHITYEGQAAIELEMASDAYDAGCYPWSVSDGPVRVLDMAPTIRAIAEDVRRCEPVGVVGRRFHNTVAAAVVATCRDLRSATGIGTVALSGGVFQNLLLLELTLSALESEGFRVLTHHQVPPNDGGIALGQAVVANRVMSNRTYAAAHNL